MARAESPGNSRNQEAKDRIRVFLSEESPFLRYGMATVLRETSDIEVVGAASGAWDPVNAVQRLRPDVILAHYPNPGFLDFDATSALVQAVPDAAVVILTPNDREEFLIRALDAGVKGYVLAQEDVDTTAEAIRSVHGGSTFISPLMASRLARDYLTRLQSGQGAVRYRQLSAREQEVLPLLASGGTDRDIAETLRVSPYTVATYRKRIMKKLDLHSKIELLKYALQRGLVDLRL
jgi:two-component system response regulator NreC